MKNSYRRARQFITTFSLQIFELFQAFHIFKNAPSDLPLFIAQLWSLVSISNGEMSELITLLSDCIGQITAENQLLIKLSGLGFLHLLEALCKQLSSNCEVARCVSNVESKAVSRSLRSILHLHLAMIIQSASENFSENSMLPRYQTLLNFLHLQYLLPKVHRIKFN